MAFTIQFATVMAVAARSGRQVRVETSCAQSQKHALLLGPKCTRSNRFEELA